ncbi:30S ribosomal protein S12 methylthiotransferase RimO [Clostridium sp. MB40-C1]|uniref:30S ribosomal protein S12 methylthiotransferase RimO n=1 Tax=Clostridium sp. MB40-C1 TaxID=3070996 RepID=UPI0027DEF5A8|nr:30S ribosomal protein S12 methylthiotransferase RimO [Clostridium sp. MB40-C1]WMJ82012.1 30S ribosomal protein S12 methylthiotransferase RimO [Clostridium sp. MB40-C1]
MTKYSIGLVSLGCDKNRIDSELILGSLCDKYKIVNNPKDADIIIVNTCGFIESSKEESINTILEMSEYKDEKCKLLIATGCLTQRYSDELHNLIPEIDIMLGVNDYEKLGDYIETFLDKNTIDRVCNCNYSDTIINEGKRILTTPSHSAYLRIGEGCSNFCTYCVIPKIRGKYRSRRMESILTEAKELVKGGVKELILVAQDTTRYGIDLYNEHKLPELIREISKINDLEWIRVLYCYPEEITDELIEEIATNKKVCNYLDIPIQHVSNSVLKRMNRKGTKEEIISNILKLKTKIKDLSLRTSIIVGFPGETDSEFQELKEFISEIKFDKLGVFKYSQEENTPAAKMENQVEACIKEKREEELMLMQQGISKENNSQKIGKRYKVLVEGRNEEYWIGRSHEMSPEIDGAIFFKCDKILNIGDFIEVSIKEALEYDLIGVVCDESCK